ncbi:DUF2637 domain-containing protein (plasmid) [Streptomyces sp. NBC_01558]|uniref:DUF2637 domain-containing protein n=1 Tax=Streptomyces sp. NBC_01558 TaxID=2975878 RepID=UPI002DDBE4C9|nr:DUF2637 domain-containing protein [Streptomyces sp. NBC_01558]WSD82771.1 DUF2637 domain-containing protein [Streptomyces sp. NBC_01558]
MAITDVPQRAAPDTPVSRPPTTVSETPRPVSGAASTVSQTPKRNAVKPGRDRLMTILSVAAATGGPLIGAIGFAMSYSTLAKKALSWGFSPDLAPWFPVGVDASIIVFLALDLYLIRKDTPWPLLRAAAHVMTFATIWFNASSQGHISDDPVRAASHGVMPLLFVIGVEAARRLFIKKTQLEAGTATDRIPLHRWILSPIGTPRFYRRMRLHNVTSYPEMIRRQQELTAYKQWLSRKHKGDLAKASDDELLPMKMAAYGYTVDEALAMPEQQERKAQQRAEEAEDRRRDADTRREIADKRAEADRLQADGELEAVRAQVEGTTAQARAHARAQASAAERAAEQEEQALETALMAEARARQAQAEHQAAQERERAAEADRRAAELERQAAEKRKQAAEADRAAAAEAQAVETQAAAEARKTAAEANRRAAETERAAAETQRVTAETQRLTAEEAERQANADASVQAARRREAEAELAAAETRLAAAEIERRAVEIEDAAKLSPRQRAVRKVARMILAVDGQADRLPLAEIQRELAVTSPGTASEYRQEAAELLAGGYRP